MQSLKTPFYLYSTSIIYNQIDKIMFCGLSKSHIHFSLMANNNIHLLKLIKERGLGVFTSSISELLIALNVGFTNDKIIFCSSNLKKTEIEQIVKINPVVIADSYNQLVKYLQCGITQIGIRISFESSFYKKYNHLEIHRQGISEKQLQQTIDLCHKTNAKIIGIHSYFGTNISDVDFYKAGLSKLLKCATLFNNIEFIDASGGFGLDFTKEESDFGIEEIVTEFHKARLKHPQLSSSIELKIEPGRYIIAPAGRFICSVTEKFEKDGKIFIGVDANLAIFPRPYIYKSQHRITVFKRVKETDKILRHVYIVGNSAKSDDFFACDVDFPFVEEGDLLCFHYAGAYCYSMSSNFCAQLKPAEYLLTTDNNIQKIRDEETVDMFLGK